jgi:cell shape-determining protein MreC
MSYHRVNKKRNYWFPIIIFLIVVVLVVVILLTGFSSFLARGGQRAGLGFWNARIKIANTASVINTGVTESKKSLIAENEMLREQIDMYRGTFLDFQKIKKENEDFRALLNVVSDPSSFVTVRILAKPKASIYNTLIVRGGEDVGVTVGDSVTAFETVLLGHVVEVYKKTSTVQLITSPGIETIVRINDESGALVTAQGHGSGNFRIALPREIEVAEGTQLIDTVSNKILGTVQATIFDPREPFQTVLARSPIHLPHLSWVQIIKQE